MVQLGRDPRLTPEPFLCLGLASIRTLNSASDEKQSMDRFAGQNMLAQGRVGKSVEYFVVRSAGQWRVSEVLMRLSRGDQREVVPET